MESLTYCTFHKMYYNLSEIDLINILLRINASRDKRTGVGFEIKKICR